MKPPKFDKISCKDPHAKLVEFLKQETYRLQGFALSLQLLAFAAVPKLLSIIQAPYDTLTIMDLVEDHLPNHPSIVTLDIHGVEADPNLVVTALIPLERQPHPGWGIWPDLCDDDRVSNMEQRIADCLPFTKSMWPGGVKSEPFITFPSVAVADENKKRSTRSKKPVRESNKLIHSIKTTPANRDASARTSPELLLQKSQHEQVLAILGDLTSQFGEFHQQFKSLRKQLRRRTRHTSCKRSSFHDLLPYSKTRNSNCCDRVCQTDPTWMHSDEADNTILKPPMDQHSKNVPDVASTDIAHNTHTDVEFPTDPILAATETASVSNMDVDGTSTVSPLISQYAAHQNLQKNCTTVDPVHEVTVHNAPQQTPPVHTTPIHNQRGVQSSSVHDTAVQNLKSPVPSAYASYDTSANDLHDSPAATPKSPPFQEMLFSDVQIHSPMCPDPITPTQPKYDSSAGPASRRACLFPLSPHPSSKDNSPTKSPASISGFAVHASVLNAFSATATSQTHVASETVEVDEAQATEDSHVIELSDCEGTPPRKAPTYFPCMEENYVAKELFKCKEISAATLICQLPQIQWDIFYRSISKFGEAYHNTPSKLGFSNNFLLQLALPREWTKTYALWPPRKSETLLHNPLSNVWYPGDLPQLLEVTQERNVQVGETPRRNRSANPLKDSPGEVRWAGIHPLSAKTGAMTQVLAEVPGYRTHMEETNFTTPSGVETTHTHSPRLADATASHQSSQLRNIAVAFAVLGTAAWFCFKTT
ncbi:hypothetical protein Bca101_059515 [Brassica carinata]